MRSYSCDLSILKTDITPVIDINNFFENKIILFLYSILLSSVRVLDSLIFIRIVSIDNFDSPIIEGDSWAFIHDLTDFFPMSLIISGIKNDGT